MALPCLVFWSSGRFYERAPASFWKQARPTFVRAALRMSEGLTSLFRDARHPSEGHQRPRCLRADGLTPCTDLGEASRHSNSLVDRAKRTPERHSWSPTTCSRMLTLPAIELQLPSVCSPRAESCASMRCMVF